MAVINKANKIIFETDTLNHTLAETFNGYIADNLPREKSSGVMEMLLACDHFNSGMYESIYPKEVTKVTLTYYKRSEKVEATIQYGEWKGQLLMRGGMSGILYDENTLWGLKENIDYSSTYDLDTPEKMNGYKITFTLREAK